MSGRTIHAAVRLLLLVVVALASPIPGAPPRVALAKDAPAVPAFRLPRPLERETKEKLRVIVVEDHRLPRVVMRVEVRSGSADEPAEKAGIANLMLLTLRQGTERRDAKSLAGELESMGAALNVSTERNAMVLTGQFLARDWAKGLALMRDLIVEPAFRTEDLERERSQVLAARASSRFQQDIVAAEHAAALVFGQHPYGRPESGEGASILGLRRDDLVAFHRMTFRPGNTFIVVVGDLDAASAQAEIEAQFRNWPRGDVSARPSGELAPFDTTRVRLLDQPDAPKTELVVALPGVKRDTPDFFAVQILNHALQGRTNGARTLFDMGRDQGAFYLTTSTSHDAVGSVLDATRAELREFRTQGPTAKEVADAKRYFVGSLPLATQTASAVASSWAMVEANGLGLDYFDRYAQSVESVTAEDVKAAAAKYLRDDRLVVVAVGPADSIRTQLASLGALEILDFRSPTGTVPQATPRATMPSEALTDESRAKAKPIVDRALQAHGGAAKLKSVSTFETRGNIQLTTPNGTIEGEMAMTVRLPDRTRIEMGLLGQRGVQVLNSNAGWSSNGDEIVDLEADQLEGLRAGLRVQVLTLLSHLAKDGPTAGWLRQEKLSGEDVDVVQIDDAGSLSRASFSKQTGLLVRLEQDEPGTFGGGMIPMARRYSDFRPVNGIMVPFKTERLARDVRLLQDTITSYEINRPVPESQFARPTR